MPSGAINGSLTIKRKPQSEKTLERYLQSRQTTILRTQVEIEADVCEVVRRHSLDYMGRGPKDVRAYLLGDLLLVRMSGILTEAQHHLAETSAEKGKILIKQVRSKLIEVARCELVALIKNCTCVNVISLHHDISTVTGEEIIAFTFDKSPAVRPIKRK
jgi:uncharacterized protein YbcI